MHSTRPLWQLEERVRNPLNPVSNTILAIMRPGCLILTATILRSSIKASRRQNIVHPCTTPPLFPRCRSQPGVGSGGDTIFVNASTFVSSNRGKHGILAQNNGAPDPRWNRPEGSNRTIKFLSHALNSRAHRD